MFPLALLPLELVLAGLAVAQSAVECTRDGLSKLNNQLGQSPCIIKTQLLQACRGNDNTPTRNCTCNTVVYNVCAACAICSGDDIPSWSSWADENTCDPAPAQFHLPSNVEVDTTMIPRWAYQQLTSAQDFNLQEAVAEPDTEGGLSRAAQIVVPIAVAIGVALLAVVGFWWYWRRQRRYPPRTPTRSNPDGATLFSDPLRWFRELTLSMHSHRLRTSRKDISWEIDDDSHLLVTRSGTPYHDPYSPEERTHAPSRSDRDSRASFAGSHARAGSSLSMLSNIEFPVVRVPTFMERFIKFKDGIRKSASYKSKHVSPVSPDQSFRIDGEAPSPVVQKFHTVADFRRPPNATVPSFSEERRQAAAARHNALEVIVERSDHDPQPDPGADDVLIISRDGGDNFTINDTTTIGTGSPRSPYGSTRHPPSAYSGALTGTTSGSGGMTRSSWLPSPHRANTSSTVSGAYPHELRRDPDLVSPPSWANKFPDPPQTFSAAMMHSARTLPTPPPPVPDKDSHTQQLVPPPPAGYSQTARTL